MPRGTLIRRVTPHVLEAGLPIHRLMGRPLRGAVRTSATGFYRRERDDHETHLREEADARLVVTPDHAAPALFLS